MHLVIFNAKLIKKITLLHSDKRSEISVFTSDDINSCPLYYTISIVGGKWQALILWHLSTSLTKRYGELKRCIPFEISHKSFTQQLKALEESGLIHRKQYDSIPPRVEYSLTDMGRELIPLIYGLRDWGAKWGDFPQETKQKSTKVQVLLPEFNAETWPFTEEQLP